MRVLIDRIRRNGHEWRVVARSDGMVEVWTTDTVMEFRSHNAAYQHVALQYKNARDYRSYKPGQLVPIQTASGSRELTVVRNTPTAITLVDDGGAQFTLPHKQIGVEHYRSLQYPEAPERGQMADLYATEGLHHVGYCHKCGETIQGLKDYTMEDHMLDIHGVATSKQSRTASDITTTPYFCRHDHTRLVPHSPSDAKKVCPDCGMVYTAKFVLSARDITAQPMGPQTDPPPQQQQPQAVPQPEMGQSDVGTGRVLSRHELIQEAETLIRNALHQGVKIGVYDLAKYMSDQYGNSPEEVLQAAQYAWKKVQFEDEDAPTGLGSPQPQEQQI